MIKGDSVRLMTHKTVTPESQENMPRQQGLLRRGARFYSNFKVPKDLRESLKREHIREALGTSDYREACRKLAFERMRWQAAFDEERRKLEVSKPEPKRKRLLLTVTEREAYEMAARYLVKLERKFRGFWEREGLKMEDAEKREIIATVSADGEGYSGGSKDYPADDAVVSVRHFLESEGIQCPPESAAFKTLRPLFRAVEAEHAARKMDTLNGQAVEARDVLFRDVFANSPLGDARPNATVGELLARFIKTLRDAERSEATLRTYEMPCRLLREGLGEDFPLSKINQEAVESLCDLLRRLPVNSAQRYPGLTLPQAVEAADKAQDVRRLNKRTQKNYFAVVSGILGFAVEKQLMVVNPAKDRWLKRSFGKDEHKTKEQFSVEDLNRLFKAPLFVGCVDDERGYAKRGSNKPRRGRFWVPLLGLFQGLRSNEACQLHIADVKERDGIPYLAIREEAEEADKSDKRLKTTRSRRDVPIHPELLKIGFLEFVTERRKAGDSPRLFPELPSGAKGYYSHVFSKWFPRFVKSALGRESKASLHSFRHSFRDAMRVAGLSAESVAALGGWQGGEGNPSLVMNKYGRGKEFFRLLARDLAKVKYGGLNLSHLHTPTKDEAPAPKRVRDR